MKNLNLFFFFLLFVSLLPFSNSSAQEYTRWNLPPGAVARLGKGKINEIKYSPDGGTIAVASSIGIWLYDAHTGVELALITGHTAYVYCIAFSPDGQTLASGSRDSTIRLWNIQTRRRKATLIGHISRVKAVAFSPDGNTLASTGIDDTVRLWDLRIRKLKKTLTGHTDMGRSVAFSPDGRLLASGSDDGTIQMWDAETGQLSESLDRSQS